MSSTLGALLLTVSLTASTAGAEKPDLPRSIVSTALQKAECSIPRNQAKIIGTEWLSPRLQIVEMTCWRSAVNAGSILFAVPVGQPRQAELLKLESWRDGRVGESYSVSSPDFDPKTRVLGSNHKGRSAGDCGTFEEWKWTGWQFRLMNVWSKSRCDGETFDWDSRGRWQVFPRRG
jgi:hypothetical protein